MVIALSIYLFLGLLCAFYFLNLIFKDEEYYKILEESKKGGFILAPYVGFLVIILFGILAAFIWPYVMLRRYVGGKETSNKEDKHD